MQTPRLLLPAIPGVSVNEDAQASVINLRDYFSDTQDADSALTYTVTGNTDSGVVTAVIKDNQYLNLTFAADKKGSANITVKCTDTGGLFTETAVAVTVNSVNDLPVISSVSDMNTYDEVPVSANITVSDIETPAGDLKLSGTSGSGSNIEFSGSGAVRTVKVTPVPGYSEKSDITVTVTDADGGSSSAKFSLSVTINSATGFADADYTGAVLNGAPESPGRQCGLLF